MLVKTEINKGSIRLEWDGEIKGVRGNELIFEYDVDVSKTPKHLANLMFGLIMSETLSWNKGIIVFDEITEKELDCIRNHLIMNFHSERAHKVFTDSLKLEVEAKNIVSGKETGRGGPVLCANGLGKDGILLANLVKELDFGIRCFFVEGQMSHDVLRERMVNVNHFYRASSIESDIIRGNYFDVAISQGFYPYFHAIPLAYHYNSEAVLAGISIHLSKTRIADMALIYPGETIFSFDYVSKASGINFSSPHFPLSLPGVQKLLAERYNESLRYQRSCMRGSPWCNNCAKCYRHHLWISASGVNPSTLGLDPEGIEDHYRGTHVAQSRYASEVLSCLNKIEGKPYEKWVFSASKPVLDLIWRGREFESIFKEHFDMYSYDVGPDVTGWTLNPSRWREWMKNGFVESARGGIKNST